MKKYYRISWNIDSTVPHLISTIILSAYIMLFINFFIGSMGGVPAFVGFTAVFFLLREMINSGNRISHHLAMESKTEVRYLILNYSVGYLLVWTAMRFIILMIRLAGWGNIKKLGLFEYLEMLYGTTMLEKWAYFFTGILMFAFIMSLFPLVVIRKKNLWFGYLVIDSGFFAGVSYLIAKICNLFIDNELEKKEGCVLDVMLLCDLPKEWQAALYIIAILAFAIGMILFVYGYAVHAYGPKPGKKKITVENFKDIESKRFTLVGKNRIKVVVVSAFAVVALVGIGVGYLFFIPSDDISGYEKVAECLTDDSVLGPIGFSDSVYAPVEAELRFYEENSPLGYIGYKDQNCESRFYKLAISNYLYKDDKDKSVEHLQMYGSDISSYKKMESLEKNDDWKLDQVFLLWDEDWVSETNYSKTATGYSECDRSLIEGLEYQFGEVSYYPEDFKDYDAYFTIRGYRELKDAMETDTPYGDWVGVILVKDNGFYYGNYDNRITGIVLKQLLNVLGGN